MNKCSTIVRRGCTALNVVHRFHSRSVPVCCRFGVYLLNVFSTKPSSFTILYTLKETSSLNSPRLLVSDHTVCAVCRRIGMEHTVEMLFPSHPLCD